MLRHLIISTLNSGMSQRELATAIGVSHGTINNIVAGVFPTRLGTLKKFEDYFQVSLSDLLGVTGYSPKVDEETASTSTPRLSEVKQIPLFTWDTMKSF